MTYPDVTKTGRIPELDILRALAIVLVVALHFTEYSGAYGRNQVLNAVPIYGVGIFLFVSGYGLYLSNRSIRGVEGLKAFFQKRVLRIYPLYWLALITYFIVFSVFRIMYPITPTPWDWFVYGSGLQFILKPDIPTILALWFIGVIVFFYILYALIAVLSQSLTRMLLLAAAAFTMVMAMMKTGMLAMLAGPGDIRFPVFFLLFFAGIVCAHFRIFSSTKQYTDRIPSMVMCVILYVSFASYAIYLFHRPVLAVAYTIIHTAGTNTFHLTGAGADLLMVFLVLPVLVILCYNLQNLYDKSRAYFDPDSAGTR